MKTTGKTQQPKKTQGGLDKKGLDWLLGQVDVVLLENYRADKSRTFTVTHARHKQIANTVKALYKDCWKLGIALGDIRNINQGHLRQWVIMKNKNKNNVVRPSTLREYCKRLQVWFTWIGKPELISDPEGFVNAIPSVKKVKYKPVRKLQKSLNGLMAVHVTKHATKPKIVSFCTQKKRKVFYGRFFQDLHSMGYTLTSVHNLKQKHIIKWILSHEDRLSAGTLQGYVSHIKTLCKWLGKENMMVKPEDILKHPEAYHRVLVSNIDKTPTNPEATKLVLELLVEIDKIDPLIGDYVRLAAAFGVRFQEMIKFKPVICDMGDYIEVRFGTKGGLVRIQDKRNAAQREALARIKRHTVSKHGSTIPKHLKYHQWARRVRYVFEKVGLTKAGCGFTPHGLRHGYLNELYTELTGELSRAQGGEMASLEAADDRYARLKVSKEAGHSRHQIANCYLGSGVKQPPKISQQP